MIITLYAGATNPRPIREDAFDSWGELADALEDLATRTADEGVSKRELTAFAPHRLSKPYRALANVAAVTLLVLDVDQWDVGEALTTADVKALVVEACTWSPDGGLVYASPSDTPEARKVRVVLPMRDECHPDDCADARRSVAEALGLTPGCGVAGAIDAAKLFFVGGLHGTPTREVWRW